MGRFRSRLADRPLDELIGEAQSDPSNDSPAMGEIVRRFDRLAVKLACGLTADPHRRDELANSARVGLIAAVRRHDDARAAFPAYARTFMRGAALRARRRSNLWGRAGSGVTVITADFTDPVAELLVPGLDADQEASPWGDGSTATAINALSRPQRDLLRRRYVDDRSLAEISRESSTSASAVRQRLATAHRALVRQLAA